MITAPDSVIEKGPRKPAHDDKDDERCGSFTSDLVLALELLVGSVPIGEMECKACEKQELDQHCQRNFWP